MLHLIRTKTTDKIVLISNYVQTLELMERLCRSKGYIASYQRTPCVLTHWYIDTASSD